jgi:uncharacterized membrane protein
VTLLHLLITTVALALACGLAFWLQFMITGAVLLVLAFLAFALLVRAWERQEDPHSEEARARRIRDKRIMLALAIPVGLLLIGAFGYRLIATPKPSAMQLTFWGIQVALGVAMIVRRLMYRAPIKQPSAEPAAVACPWCQTLNPRQSRRCSSCDSDMA